ncbi:NAD(P)H-binding protein [Bifidobacterium pseudolongum]|uniref:NAD(P)H-binding protein n=1 Tax=Bifidobacterium pseudolongum TaxID=1694 RepID=UPI0010E42B02|nr:NAD(P)H-binding protein [Bifidobacterium pseudolongum]RYQ64023.1 NAD-dependent dehydratase [Bifidobacterium pseudolongum subsp. globosum]
MAAGRDTACARSSVTPRARFTPDVEVVEGDLTSVESMREALDGIDGIVFTHGSNGGPTLTESVDYGAVRNALDALDGRAARIALMTSIGVTNMDNDYNRSTQAHDWKRRSERLVRASGNEYTIVRPGWFDMEGTDEHRLEFRQGDRGPVRGPQDGSVARRQIVQTLVTALGCEESNRRTLELVDVRGAAQTDTELVPMFGALEPDTGFDGVNDRDNFPENAQPKRVREDLEHVERMARERD